MPNDWGRVAFVTRLYGGANPEWVNSWTMLIATGGRSGDAIIPAPVNHPTHEAANMAVRAFLTDPTYAECDSLLFVDHDHTFAPDTLERLRSDVRGFEYDILGALYVARFRRVPLVYKAAADFSSADPLFELATDWTPGDIVPVAALGLGFTLIRRKVLEALPDPWFYYLTPAHSEDVAFIQNALESGYRVGVHTGVTIGHLVTEVLRVNGAGLATTTP